MNIRSYEMEMAFSEYSLALNILNVSLSYFLVPLNLFIYSISDILFLNVFSCNTFFKASNLELTHFKISPIKTYLREACAMCPTHKLCAYHPHYKRMRSPFLVESSTRQELYASRISVCSFC